MHHKVEFAIVGGGVAGLSAAIALRDKSLVIEGGVYPSHKICGEFLSPECLPFLKSLGIGAVPISKAVFHTPKQTFTFPFLPEAGGLSHISLDPALAKAAKERGAQILTETKTLSFKPKNEARGYHHLELSNGDSVKASQLIVAAGRFASYGSQKPCYTGYKAHFEGFDLDPSEMRMFSMPGAYLGISPIEGGKWNVACLCRDPVTIKEVQKVLGGGKNQFGEWMQSPIPQFGVKRTPDWSDVYFIGDAAVTVPPACGNGLSMAIFGGQMAAEYALKGEWRLFKEAWKKRCSSQLFFAKALHEVMMNPVLGDGLIRLNEFFPLISRKFFELTRHD